MLIIEIAMLAGGLYSIITAKVPSFLIGGSKYRVEGQTARLFGVLLILPLPVAILGALILTLLFGEKGRGYSIILELVTVFVIAILASVLIRVLGKKTEYVKDVEATISKKSQGALVFAIFSIPGFATLICGPLAILYANQALKLINENQVGEQYRSKAKTARILALVFLAITLVAIIIVTIAIIANTR